jgi:hypothetical protein
MGVEDLQELVKKQAETIKLPEARRHPSAGSVDVMN